MNFKIPQLVVGILTTIYTKRYEMVHWTHQLQTKPRKLHIVQHEHCIDHWKHEKQNFAVARVIIKNIYPNSTLSYAQIGEQIVDFLLTCPFLTE
jgi:hypothetical protein